MLSCLYMNYCTDLILGEAFYILASFISQILDFMHWLVCIFIFDGVTVKTKNSCRICMLEFFIDFKPKRNSTGEKRQLYVYVANESTHKKNSLYFQ